MSRSKGWQVTLGLMGTAGLFLGGCAEIGAQPHPEVFLRWQPITAKSRHKLEAAERLFVGWGTHPPLGRGEEMSTTRDSLLEAALQESLAMEPSGRGYEILGRFHLESGHYEKSVKALTRALRSTPQRRHLQAYLRQARHALRVQAMVKTSLPPPQKLLKMLPFPVEGRCLWAVLSCERVEDGGIEASRENGLISVFEEQSKGLTFVWRSKIIPSLDGRQYHSLGLWAFPMTGRKIPELVLEGVCTGGSANPSLMHIYRWMGRGFRQVLAAESPEESLWIEPHGTSGRYWVRGVQLVGVEMSHGEMIRWANIYAWNGKHFVEADGKYPMAFRRTKGEILERLQRHPKDPTLLKYLGKLYLYEGRRRLAFTTLRRMEQVCRERIRRAASDYDSWWNLGEVAQLRGDGRRAQACFRQSARVQALHSHR